MTIKKGRTVGLIGFALALFAGLLQTPQALAQNPFPTQIPTKAEALEAAVKLIPGLDKAGISNFKASNNAASGEIKLKGKTVTVVAFKRPGIAKVLIAIAPTNFKLTDFLPIPRGTPIDGVAFRNMAFVYVPKGAAKNNVSTSGLPQKIVSALNKSGSRVDLKEGLNLFGEADFASAGGVRKVLRAIGLNNFTLPLSGTLPKNLFTVNPKSVRGKLKDQLLDALRLNLKLTRLRIPGMPNSVAIRDAGLAILSKKLKNKRQFIAGVNGRMVAKVGNKNIDFNFYILADKAGADKKLVLKGDTETATTLPFFKPLKLTGMNLVATKSGGKWDVVVNAKAKLNNKNVDVAVTRDADKGTSAEIKGKIKLSDLLPGSISIPGITNVEFDDLQISKGFLQVTGKVKKLDTVIAVFKHNGKTYVAINNPKTIKISSLITAAKGTPLDDASFEYMTYIWAPRGGAESGMEPSELPSDIADAIKNVVEKVDLKAGLNVIGRMNIERNSKVGKVLVKVGAYKDHLPLVGKLSTKLFKKGSGAELKNAILDSLDLKISLPKISMPGLSNVANIRSTTLAIKGLNNGGKRSIDVKIAGELDVKVGNEGVVFDFDVKVKPRPGKKPEIIIAATEAPGKTITIEMLEEFTLRKLSFNMNNAQDRWVWEISGDTEFRSRTVNVGYVHDPKAGKFMYINTKMTLAEIAGGSLGLPGLDDVTLDNIQVWNNKFVLESEVKGKKIGLVAFKRPGISKPYVLVQIGNATATDFIPGSENTPLKDVKFENLSFLYSPARQAGKASDSGIVPNVRGWLNYAGKDVAIKPGLNIYGKLVAQPSGEMGRLLKKVGVTDLSLPLNGKFSPKAFSKNLSGAAVKNAILDKLDLNIKLPALNIPEVDRFLAFKNGRLKIKGKTPDGNRGINVAISGDADLRVKGDRIAFNVDVGHDKSDLSFTGSTDRKWTHPLGINFLDLDTLSLSIDKNKGKYDIAMAAKTDIGSYSRLDVGVNIDEKNGRVTDASFNLDGPLKLSEIPGVKDIPNSDKFTINTIKISDRGIEAKTDFGGRKDLDVYLFNGSGWNMIVRQDDLTMTEFVPPLKNTPLKNIALSEAAIVLSKDGLQGPLSNFSPIAQDALKDIYGASAANINVGSGLSLIAAFEPKKSRGRMAGAFRRLGLTQERMILTGGIGGLFGGPTRLNVKVALDGQTSAKNQPKWMKSKPGVKSVFSMIATETAGQFDVEFGIGSDIIAKVHGTELLFDTKTALVIEDEKIGIKIVGTLKDQNGWHKPFGIPGFTLKDVGMDLGLDEDGAIHLGFDGNIEVGGDKYAVAADADLLPEAGVPQDIAFKGSASKVDMFFVEEIAIDMIGHNFKLGIPGGILPTFTNVKFAFVTPGAQDPDINITGEGFALAGGMNWLDHQMGAMNVSVSPTKGIYAAGKIDNFKLGPLTMKNNDFKMDIGLKSLPSLTVDSDIVLLKVASERFHLKFDKKGVAMAAHIGAGTAADITAKLKLSGTNVIAKKPNFKKADFSVSGDIKLDVNKFITGPAQTALNDVVGGLNKAFKAGEKKVKTARKKVDGLTTKINAMRAKVRREKAAAESRVQGAENRVNDLKGRLAGEWRGYHHCHGWFSKWPCRIKYGIEIGGTKAAKDIADDALKLAKTLVSHFPIDLDPRVAALISDRDVAKTALNLALDVIKGADSLDGFMKKATAALTDELAKGLNINIKKAAFKGDLKGIITKDQPVDLSLDAVFWGAEIKDTFAFKIENIGKDLPSDVEQLSLLGLYALHDLVEKGLKDIPSPLKHKLEGAIAQRFDGAEAKNKRTLAKYNLTFAKYNAAAALIQADYAAYSLSFLKANLSKIPNPLDYDASETFADEQIEVGHSGLCLTNIGGLVKQHTCTKGNDRRWSTRPVSGAAGVKAGLGFVNIFQTHGGDCIAPEGTWAMVATQFDDFTFPEQKFTGNGRISVRGCVNTKEFYWKVLKHGDGWMQIVNLATNQCLNFSNSDARPGKAQADWKPCVGAANQVFRVADSATPVYHADNIIIRNDQLGLCVGSANPKDSTHSVPMTTCNHAARFDYMVNIRGDVKFISRFSGKCLQPSSYTAGAKMIEVACTQLDYQWWEANNQPGGIIIKNAQTKQCTEPPFNIKHTPPTQVACTARKNAVFTPLKNDSGPTWALIYGGNINVTAYNAARPIDKGRARPCAFEYNGSFVPGLVTDILCELEVNKKHHGSSNFRIMTSAPGVEWRSNANGLPVSAIPTGGFGGVKPQTLYSCRQLLEITEEGGLGRSVGSERKTRTVHYTNLGWTTDGKTCHIASETNNDSPTVFDILSRSDASFFQLNMSNVGRLKNKDSGPATAPVPAPAPAPAPAAPAATKKRIERELSPIRRRF